MRKDINPAALAILFATILFVCPAGAADYFSTVGVVDFVQVSEQWPAWSTAKKLAAEAAARKATSEVDNLQVQLDNTLNEAIAGEANSRNLTIVFDKTAVFSGGRDITSDVLKRLNVVNFRPDGLRMEQKSSVSLIRDEIWPQHPGITWLKPGSDPSFLKDAAILDRDKVVLQYPRAQEAAQKLRAEEERIKALVDRSNKEFEASRGKVSDAELQKMQARLQGDIDSSVQKARMMVTDLESSLENDVTSAIRGVAQTHGCDIVLSIRAKLPGVDITDETIARLANPSLATSPQKPKFPARPAGETPPAAINRPVKDKWALVVGISKFQHPEYNLKFAAKDATDFYNYLINEGHFKKDHVLLLLNEQATRENIMNAFGDQFLPAVSEDGDLVVIFVSTHGTPAAKDKGGRNYIVAHDTVINKLYSTGVDMDELSNRIKEGVKTNRALIVMDTCYSGAGIPGAKALNAYDNFDATNLAQGCGRLVITSSSPNERSWESQVSQNGIFTKYLLQSLRENNGKLDVKSVYEKTRDKVQWEVKSAFGQTQTPQFGGSWEGNALILSAPASQSREIFNPALSELIKKNASLVGRDAAAPPPLKQVPRR